MKEDTSSGGNLSSTKEVILISATLEQDLLSDLPDLSLSEYSMQEVDVADPAKNPDKEGRSNIINSSILPKIEQKECKIEVQKNIYASLFPKKSKKVIALGHDAPNQKRTKQNALKKYDEHQPAAAPRSDDHKHQRITTAEHAFVEKQSKKAPDKKAKNRQHKKIEPAGIVRQVAVNPKVPPGSRIGNLANGNPSDFHAGRMPPHVFVVPQSKDVELAEAPASSSSRVFFFERTKLEEHKIGTENKADSGDLEICDLEHENHSMISTTAVLRATEAQQTSIQWSSM